MWGYAPLFTILLITVHCILLQQCQAPHQLIYLQKVYKRSLIGYQDKRGNVWAGERGRLKMGLHLVMPTISK